MVAMGLLPIFVEFCLWNIAQTDSVTVQEAILRFDSSVEIFSIFSIEITIFINQVMSVVCPGQPACNDHGQCANSTCICDPGTASHSTVCQLSTKPCCSSDLDLASEKVNGNMKMKSLPGLA